MKNGPTPVARDREVNKTKKLLTGLVRIGYATNLIIVFVLDLTDAVGNGIENQVDKLTYCLTNNCPDGCLPEILVLGHIIALWLISLAIRIDLNRVVIVWDADARQNGDTDREDIS